MILIIDTSIQLALVGNKLTQKLNSIFLKSHRDFILQFPGNFSCHIFCFPISTFLSRLDNIVKVKGL